MANEAPNSGAADLSAMINSAANPFQQPAGNDAVPPMQPGAGAPGVPAPVQPNLNVPADNPEAQNRASFDAAQKNMETHGTANAPGTPGAQLANQGFSTSAFKKSLG